jgi:RNA-directed DNA polymerase
LHYAFDAWMAREFPTVPFERYCDDIVVHCVSERQTQYVGERVAARLGEVGLRLHPTKTRAVYCPRGGQRGVSEYTSFTFLGIDFAQRSARSKRGNIFNGFLPAVSKNATKKMSREVRRWRLHRWTTRSLDELAAWVNQIVPGWLNYYGRYYKSAMMSLLHRINAYILRWARKKYKRLRPYKKALAWWKRVTRNEPGLFKHWAWTAAF